MDAMKTLRRLRTQPATMSDDEFDKTLNGAMEAVIQTNETETTDAKWYKLQKLLQGSRSAQD